MIQFSVSFLATTETTLLEGHIRVKLQYMDRNQKVVQAKLVDTVSEFKRYLKKMFYLLTVVRAGD